MKIKELDSVLFLNEADGVAVRQVFRVKKHVKKIKGAGLFNLGNIIDLEYGEKIVINKKEFCLLPASVIDKIEGLERKAQIITPKDAAQILLQCSIKSGDVVVEAGLGSAALTIPLAHIVQPLGRIISYETRQDFIDVGRRNIEFAGFEEFCDIKVADVTKGIEENNVDAVIFDIPNPWDALEHAHSALKIGGHLASYSPTINQVEKTVGKLNELNFGLIKTFETLQRELTVKESGTRPSFDMLGHTGYVTVARKIKPSIATLD